jgi:hypothetical protein
VVVPATSRPGPPREGAGPLALLPGMGRGAGLARSREVGRGTSRCSGVADEPAVVVGGENGHDLDRMAIPCMQTRVPGNAVRSALGGRAPAP